MRRVAWRSLRARMAVLLATAIAMTVAAALALGWTLAVADNHVQRLASAQRRLELLSAISGRVADYALIALQATERAGAVPTDLEPARERVSDAFARFQGELAEEVGRLGNEEQATLVAARSRVVAQLRGRFGILDREAREAVLRAGRGEAGAQEPLKISLGAFASSFGPALSQAIEEERAAAKTASAEMSALRRWITWAAVAAVLSALAVAALLYRKLAGPLIARVTEVAGAAKALAEGRSETRLRIEGHDELSLAMVRFNRMAAQLGRREARLLADQRRLQEIVDERTAELRSANARLSDIDQTRRRFFTDVSHELRTPLTVILGEAEVSLRGRTEAEDLRCALQTIRARAGRLHRRVEDLLRIARSETGEIELDLSPVDTAALLRDAQEGLNAQARSSGHSLRIDFGPPGMIVEGDAEWLRQVVEGLLSNALRHSPPGGEVRISARRVGSDIRIEIADAGEGILPEELPHVFDRFYRGASSGEGSGFGIGLALARWVIERHGGTIAIESRSKSAGEGISGTRVVVCLPRAAPLRAAAAR